MLVQLLGYIASALVFVAFYMRTMLPLRFVAIASNMAFLSYGIPLHLWPVVVLHSILLPLNLMRIFQIRRLLARIEAARSDSFNFGTLAGSLRPVRYPAGTVIFAPGDKGDAAYLLAKGEVDMPNVHMRAGPGEVFGLTAFLSDGVRFGNAIARSDVELYRIDAATLDRAFHQDPAFATALNRLLTKRLLSYVQRLETNPLAANPV